MLNYHRRTYYPIWIEQTSFEYWVRQGAIVVTETGEENTYAVNECGQEFFCKHNH